MKTTREQKNLAQAVNELRSPYFHCEPSDVHSNLVFIDLFNEKLSPSEFCRRMSEVGEEEKRDLGRSIIVKILPMSAHQIRAALHRHITDEDIEATALKLRYVATEMKA